MTMIAPCRTHQPPLNALGLAKAARLVYKSADQILVDPDYQRWNFDRCQFLSRNHTQALITGNDRLLILAFRGTERSALKDWMTNIDVAQIPDFGGNVHRGFTLALYSVLHQIQSTLTRFRDNHQPLFITGHSLGGALATLATVILEEMNYSVQATYTFGSPRVGDRSFSQAFDQKFWFRTFRFVNHNDVVTRVAPRQFGRFDYDHVGQCLYFDAAGQLHQADGFQFWQHFKYSVRGSMDDFLNPSGRFGITDHEITAYERNLALNTDYLRN
ncbi:lipase family protein [Pantanalinema rosaneae CENA516]|uniref:lipase family protein n=1 Tax=Pantanalinema rosaneae TaxID=1620701 RepID=UPI003D6DDD66